MSFPPTMADIQAWLAQHKIDRGTHNPHLPHNRPDHHKATQRARGHIAHIPNVSNFVANHGATPVSGYSGIVPFARTHDGQVLTPIGGKKWRG